MTATHPPCPPPPTTCSPPSTASASPHPTVTHPPLFTVEQSQALRGTIPGGHTKNLFLKDKKGALFLVTALEDAAIELKSLHRRLGATGRFSFGSADLMLRDARRRARRGDAVRRHQRHRPAASPSCSTPR